MIFRLSTMLVMMAGSGLALHAQSLDATTAHEKLTPSIVSLSEASSYHFRTGTLIDNKGAILTSFEAAKAISESGSTGVRVWGKNGGKPEVQYASSNEEIMVHPSYDLALLRCNPFRAVLTAATFAPKTPAPAPGSKCFVIGVIRRQEEELKTSSGKEKPSLKIRTAIVEGIISATGREVQGAKYIQFSATLDKDATGSALFDAAGRLLGIVTTSISDAEGIAFAVPLSEIDFTKFVPIKERSAFSRDGEMLSIAEAAERAGAHHYRFAMTSKGEERTAKLEEALVALQKAAQLEPDRPETNLLLAFVLRDLKHAAPAMQAVERVLKAQPDRLQAKAVKGDILLVGRETSTSAQDAAVQQWAQVLPDGVGKVEDYETKKLLGEVARNISKILMQQRKWLAAAYMMQWTKSADWERYMDLDDSLEMVGKQSQGPEMEQVTAMREGFTKRNLLRMALGEAALNVPAAEGVKPVTLVTVTPQQKKDFLSSLAATLGPTQVAVPAGGLEIALPDTPGKAVLAYGGWKLVMHFPNLDSIGVLNLATGKMEGLIDCTDKEPMLAAGGRMLSLYLPGMNRFELYDLSSLEQKASVGSPLPGAVVFMGMGALNPTRMMVLHQTTTEKQETLALVMVTLPDYQVVQVPPADKVTASNSRFESSPKVRREGGMDENGTMAAVCRPKVSPSGLKVYKLNENNAFSMRDEHEDEGLPTVTQNGQLIVGNKAVYQDTGEWEMKEINLSPQQTPVLQSAMVGHHGVIQFYSTKTNAEFVIKGPSAGSSGLNLPVEVALAARIKDNVEEHETNMVASATADRIVCLLRKEKKAVFFPLGVKGWK